MRVRPPPPVDDADYQTPFRFTGTLHKLSIKIEPTKLSAAEETVAQHKVGAKD